MFDSFRRYSVYWVGGLFLLIAGSLAFLERRDAGPGMGPAGRLILLAGGASQSVADHGLARVGHWWDRYLDLVDVEAENVALRAENDRLREENARLLGVMQENARLRGLVGLQASWPGLELVPARVIAQDLSPFFRVVSIRLDTGGARVTPGMPVISSAGVVGSIFETTGSYATVLLAVDPRSSIDVLVQRNRARGLLVGEGHADDYVARVAYLQRRDTVTEGDVLVTSGMGGRFPADLVVGRIARVAESRRGMFQEVLVEPAVDFSRVEEVFILVGTGE